MGKIPARSSVRVDDTWDLSRLYADDAIWDRDLEKLAKITRSYRRFAGRLASGPKILADCLTLDSQVSRLSERLRCFAYLRSAEDQSSSLAQQRLMRIQHATSKASEASSFLRPEILRISEAKMKRFLASAELARFRLRLERILRYRPFTLSDSEERLLAMQGEMADAAQRAFRQLLDADMRFGIIADNQGRRQELSHANYRRFLLSPRRSVRRAAFREYYAQFMAHEHTLAALLNGSVQRDVYYARARGYESALHVSLFADQVPVAVYTNLIRTVRQRLPVLYRYLELRRRKLGISTLHAYDLDVPLFTAGPIRRTWSQAVAVILESLSCLGEEYARVLEQGLRGRWCDRYPNRGKQSGAFSYGTYDGEPYILMNYKPDVMEDVFTLTHEAGHSMHSYYSSRRQPYEYYAYTIFVAEVASTVHEQLLSHHLLQHAQDRRERASLLQREIDAIRATIIRQTMFAEFEKIVHEAAEAGEPLTLAAFTHHYEQLLRGYFGTEFAIDPPLTLECLRIPHFYRAFYVYKYATGMSAAIALSRQLLSGDPDARHRYLRFLGAGRSRDPLDLLLDAGVDMSRPQPVAQAMDRLETLVEELETLV